MFAVASPSKAQDSSPVVPRTAADPFRILVVDSDLNLCTSVSRTLVGLGYGLDVAYDADEARGLADRHHYAVGLFGEQLTDGDGIRLFSELCPRQKGMLGVLVAPVANLPTVARAISAGMSRVAPIPIDFNDLVLFLASVPAAAVSPDSQALVGAGFQGPLFTEEFIAELSAGDISQRLTLPELIGVIRSVEYPFAGKERLEFFDRDTLERVVHLVRRWCRNRSHRPAW